MAGLLLQTIWLWYLRDILGVELMILVAATNTYYILYILYIYIYIYLVSIYICIFVYFYIGQSCKEVNFADIKNFSCKNKKP